MDAAIAKQRAEGAARTTSAAAQQAQRGAGKPASGVASAPAGGPKLTERRGNQAEMIAQATRQRAAVIEGQSPGQFALSKVRRAMLSGQDAYDALDQKTKDLAKAYSESQLSNPDGFTAY
tara:strand:+ start:845 stop:1204 length:360 start_codon:yes stop_codon:yes gene_type:complete